MKVTVLLAVYNAGAPLATAIRSILNQDLRDFEFLIIDDASTDRSADLIRDFARRDSRIQVHLHERNQGLAATLNEGLARANTPLVARMDQDDESLPSRLARQMTEMSARPDLALCGSYVYHMGRTPARDRLVAMPTGDEAIRECLPQYNMFYHPAVMLNREKVLAVGGYDGRFRNAEDYDLWLRLSAEYPLANISEPLFRYRFSTGGMTLGRKWEQLYYVFLAQARHRRPTAPFCELESEASRLHAQTDRREFLKGVVRGTCRELRCLGYSGQIARLLWMYRRDLGWVATRSILAESLRVPG
ncbi:glycosyltransferase [uncultured Thiodictyon sp.]|uniref:glycosyltransferase n=1 Tax=uncultured Thiodictyon sp. TaxID=1846217 RepID=UPI0025D51CE0|nr:glycosyltransferase [uncultured Thiodictyon sp.]